MLPQRCRGRQLGSRLRLQTLPADTVDVAGQLKQRLGCASVGVRLVVGGATPAPEQFGLRLF